MHENEITSLVTVIPLKVAVVVVEAVCWKRLAVVRLFAVQAQPVVAVAELPKVIAGVQAPVVPETKVPAVAPPTREDVEQPLAVKVVPKL